MSNVTSFFDYGKSEDSTFIPDIKQSVPTLEPPVEPEIKEEEDTTLSITPPESTDLELTQEQDVEPVVVQQTDDLEAAQDLSIITPEDIIENAYKKQVKIIEEDYADINVEKSRRLTLDQQKLLEKMRKQALYVGMSVEDFEEIVASKAMDTSPQSLTNKMLKSASDTKEKTLAFLNNRNVVTSGLTEKLLFAVDQDMLTLSALNAIVLGDQFFNPITTAVEIPHNFADVQEALRNGDIKGASIHVGVGILNTLAAVPLAKVGIKGVNATWKSLSGGKGAYHDVQEAMINETQRAAQIKAVAKANADQNPELRNQIIEEFQERFEVTISTKDADGNLVIDPELVRATGKKTISDYFDDMGYVASDSGDTVRLTDLQINDESLAIPILDPEKMDMFVSTIVDLRKSNPKIDQALKTTGDEKFIDKLFDETMKGELFGSEELLDVLTKNGLSFEEYVLGVVGSGSQAGKILNKLSQAARYKPSSVKEAQEIAAKVATQKAFGRIWAGTVLRMENIRRGLLVSSLATAARNYQSGLIRSPMESMADVMDTALLTYGKSKSAGDSTAKSLLKFHNSINPLVRDGTWSGSFKNLHYLFRDQQSAEQFTDYVLSNPKLADQMSRMFTSVQEIQELTLKGKATTKLGKGIDAAASRAEDFVWAVNGPNRWQEHMIRRATFLSELERQTKINWDLDLKTALKEGKIQELLNDAPNLRPEDGKSFMTMVDESVTKALDVTYAKQPDFAPFKTATNMITKSGFGTMVIPFPRFMFNSMEYMAQNTGGMFLVPIRKAISKESREAGLTLRDRQDISRNLVGWATISAVYKMREEYGTEDYTMFANEGKQVDISAQYPMRQIGWITEFAKRLEEDTLGTWYGMDKKEIMETWLGTSARTGVGNIFLTEMTEIIKGSFDITDNKKRDEAIGRGLGQYLNTFFTPLFQIPEAQRSLGIRTSEAKDFRGSIPNKEEQLRQLENIREQFGEQSSEFVEAQERITNLPFTENTVIRKVYEQIAQRGGAAPSFEEERRQRIDITKGKKMRPNSTPRLLAGLTITDRDNDIQSYLKEIGFGEATFELGSKSKISKNQIAENEFISLLFPMVVDKARTLAKVESEGNKKEEHILAKAYVTEFATELRNRFNDPSLGGASKAAIFAEKISRLNKTQRARGMIRFKKVRNGELPKLTSLTDLMLFYELSKSDVKIFPKN